MSGRERVGEVLQLQLAAADPGVRITQLCLIDHSSQTSPHIHIQCRLSDSTQSPWIEIDDVAVADVQAEIDELPGSVRLHIHEPKNKTTAAKPAVIAKLPKIELCESSVTNLALTDANCPICLSEYEAGAEVTCMPCDGLHKAHTECINNWLKTANSCPTCRYKLPDGADDTQFLSNCMKGRTHLLRLKRPPAVCIPAAPAPSSAPTPAAASSSSSSAPLAADTLQPRSSTAGTGAAGVIVAGATPSATRPIIGGAKDVAGVLAVPKRRYKRWSFFRRGVASPSVELANPPRRATGVAVLVEPDDAPAAQPS